MQNSRSVFCHALQNGQILNGEPVHLNCDVVVKARSFPECLADQERWRPVATILAIGRFHSSYQVAHDDMLSGEVRKGRGPLSI